LIASRNPAKRGSAKGRRGEEEEEEEEEEERYCERGRE
jgi:hypothetical protein